MSEKKNEGHQNFTSEPVILIPLLSRLLSHQGENNILISFYFEAVRHTKKKKGKENYDFVLSNFLVNKVIFWAGSSFLNVDAVILVWT